MSGAAAGQTIVVEATLSPEAFELVQRIMRHLTGNRQAGLFVVFSDQQADCGTVETIGHRISPSAVKAGAGLMIKAVCENLHGCGCGADHGVEIAELEQASLLLSGAYAHLVRQ